ncbi:hypothetical protein PL498_21895, partial [Bacteroides xylanisolvens]|nr:hypothetical protein [Bacteroides xylanisolvens]
MAKSMTVGKRENEKKRIAKREEKLKKKENKKLSGSSNSFEDIDRFRAISLTGISFSVSLPKEHLQY